MIYEWQPHEQCKYFLGSIQTQRTEAWHKYALSTHSNCVYCGGGLKVIVGVGCAFGQCTHKNRFQAVWLPLHRFLTWTLRIQLYGSDVYEEISWSDIGERVAILGSFHVQQWSDVPNEKRQRGKKAEIGMRGRILLGCCGEIYVKMLATHCSARRFLKLRSSSLSLLRVSF